MQHILHQLNIDAIGGVEYLFKNFLERSLDHQQAHHVLVCNRTIHSRFKKTLEEKASSIHKLKYYKGLKLPKPLSFLRLQNAKSIYRRLKADLIISWNRIGKEELLAQNLHSTTRLAYYDHGAAWFCPSDSTRSSYFQAMNTLLSCSFASKRMLELRLGVNKPITVIRNSVRSDLLNQKVDSKVLPKQRPIHLGIVGRLIPVKGVNLALHAIKQLKERGCAIHLFIAGTGKEELSLKTLTRELAIEKEVTFLGYVADIATFYKNIDIALCPSLRDPLPLVSLEAMACACPVIATQVDGFPEVIHNGVAGYCLTPQLPLSDYPKLGGSLNNLPEFVYDPEADTLCHPRLLDPSSIADAVEALISSEKRFTAMSLRAMDAARKKSFTAFMEELNLALNESCLN